MRICAALLVMACARAALCDPTVVSTEYLGPLVGEDAGVHPDNLAPHRMEFYGTDLGYTYEFKGQIQFLFGDTWATEAYAPIDKTTGARTDDSFGSVPVSAWPDPGKITSQNMPLVKIGQYPDSGDVMAIDPGYAMDLGKTPEAGFSNGEREFGIFLLGKPEGCTGDTQCSTGLSCDTGLGYRGAKVTDEMGYTGACLDGSSGCNADTILDADGHPVASSGFCSDRTATVWNDSPPGRIAAVGITQRVAVRDADDPHKYTAIRDWVTSKFLNATVRTVERFVPSRGARGQDYSPAKGSGAQRRVLLWGRPGFLGVGKNGRALGLYFAYVDVPTAPDFKWDVQYFTGTDAAGVPQFSSDEKAARPADLDSGKPGIQADAEYDVVDQMSVVWIGRLKKWVMFYGGGMGKLTSPPLPSCGLVEAFTGEDCADADVGNGAFRMRTADNPWGPWSPAQDVIVGGDPADGPVGQYGPGGALHHPDCKAPGCAPPTDTKYYQPGEYGFFYCANIIQEWIKPAGRGVDVIWNASTWDPYRVVLLRTRINP